MTVRTSLSRGASSAGSGMTNGMLAAVILCLARTSRCAIVDSGTRNACAIWAVVMPITARIVRAIRTSTRSAG